MSIVYALIDPRSEVIRYVGKTTRPLGARMNEHAREAMCERTRRAYWLRKLVDLGLVPRVIVLERDPADLNEAERFWIAAARAQVGIQLVNGTDGGEGGDTWSGRRHSVETRAKMSAAQKGRVISAQARARSSATQKGRAMSEARKQRQREIMTGVKRSPETRERMRLSAARVWKARRGED